ncbi:MAG TPA: hypothetical protein VH092_38415, partial [Urbifossiella sp.]|nr:hypothetical protein [Urbifossiella sp.]
MTSPPAGNPTLILVVSLALFAAGMARHRVEWVVIVTLVLLLHEAGHLFGMWLFGYRDLRVFFIPFIGAAASGRNETAPVRHEAVMLLLGPVPGILLGFGLAATGLTEDGPVAYDAAL